MSTSRDTMSTSGDIMSTLVGVQYIGRCHEYIGGCSVHPRDTMSISGGYHGHFGVFNKN